MSSWKRIGFGGDDDGSSSGLSDLQLSQENEVFLSFRGTDTRKGFTDYLYRSLYNSGVRVFRDNENLHVGEEIGSQLTEGIKQSKICIPIFSKNYAESKWCLKEFALMMECRKTMKQIVLPIFYDVTPEEVKRQTGKFQEAFDGHECNYGADTVQQWRNALSEVGSLKGWELEKATNGHEAELVDMVVEKVVKKLKKAHIVLKENVIGIEEQVNAVIQLLKLGANDVRIVGIWGMGGIGKTTLANAVYNQIVDEFECCGFLENIREKSSHWGGLESLQTVLVSKLSKNKCGDVKSVNDGIKELKDKFRGKKVLILLDDVDKKKQLEALGGRADWFGRESRVIVTTRDSGLFDKSRDKVYETKLMDTDQALQLFCNHAFKTYLPPSELRELAMGIVWRTGGLPLALEVIGGFLIGQEREVWESVNEKLQNRPHEEVEHTLKISYDALTDEQKYIFLDIACFHIEEHVKVAGYMWKDRFDFSPECDVRVLELMSLIKIGKMKHLWMHDQLRDFGRAVVERQNEDSTGKRIWLWKSKAAIKLLRECTESPRVEAICLDNAETQFTDEQLRYLPKLKFIKLCSVDLMGNFQGCLPNLRWLDWKYAPFNFIPSNLTLKNLVVLNLSRSGISDDWNWSSMQVIVTLKVLNLSSCENLIRGPDFSFFPNLERVELAWCSRLKEISSSIGKLKSLNFLNLHRCEALKKLPHEMKALESLVELDLSNTGINDLPVSRYMKKIEIIRATYCKNLSKFPDCIGELTSLTDLQLSVHAEHELPESIGLLKRLKLLSVEQSSISKLPESIGQLTSLVELHLAGSRISALPRSIGNLETLEVIDASGCPPMLEEFPNIRKLRNLKVLKINGAFLTSLPETITSLPRLRTLQLYGKKDASSFPWLEWPKKKSIPRLETVPQLPVSLTSIKVTCCSTVPIQNLSHLTNLKKLELRNCSEIVEFSIDLAKPLKLQELSIAECTKLRHIGTLPLSLHELRIEECNSLAEIQGLGDLISLTKLDLQDCASLQTLPNMSKLTSLKFLDVARLTKLHKLEGLESLDLRDLEGLDGLTELNTLRIYGCEAIEKLPNLSNLKLLHEFVVDGCEKLQDLEGLDGLGALKKLFIASCHVIEQLPDLSNLKLLERLSIFHCEKLQYLEGIDSLEALKELNIADCKAIEQLSNLSNLKLLESLWISHCERLQYLEGVDGLEALKRLDIAGCTSIEHLSNLSNLKLLEKFSISWKGLQNLEGLYGFSAIEKLPHLSNWKLLEELEVKGCEKLQDLEGLDGLRALKKLCLKGCKAIEELPDLSNLKLLTCLDVGYCEKLQVLEGLDKLVSLEELCISGCTEIKELPNLSKFERLIRFEAEGCEKLPEGFDELKELAHLNIGGCKAIRRLPNLPNLKYLITLQVAGCENLEDLDGLNGLEKLRHLNIEGCKAIRSLPNLSNLKNLKYVMAKGCEKLKYLEGLDGVEALHLLYIQGCKALRKLPNLSNLKFLRRVNVKGCEKLQQLGGVEDLKAQLQIEKLVVDPDPYFPNSIETESSSPLPLL